MTDGDCFEFLQAGVKGAHDRRPGFRAPVLCGN